MALLVPGAGIPPCAAVPPDVVGAAGVGVPPGVVGAAGAVLVLEVPWTRAEAGTGNTGAALTWLVPPPWLREAVAAG